jgi:glycosyltransferase involved in cell wall biosynthesis
MSDSTGNPLVSLIVRTKDRPKLLKKALRSIGDQIYRPIEVVLVNDGGCDLNIDGLKAVLGDVTLKNIRLEKNTGRAHAGNVGIENAKGDYVGFLDDDDRLRPEHVSILARFLDASDYKVVYGNSEKVSLSYNPDRSVFSEQSGGIFSSADFSADKLLFQNYIPLISILFNGRLLREIGGFDESFEIFEDWDLLIRVSSVAPFYHIDKVTSAYTQWSRDYQIAYVNWPNAKNYYLKVLAKHSEKRIPEAVYQYCIDKEQTIHEREKTIAALQDRLDQLNMISEKSDPGNTGEYNASFHQDILYALQKQLSEKERYIEELHNSVGWKILTFYRKKIKANLFPPGTKVERVYNMGLKGLYIAHRDGLEFLFHKVKSVRKRTIARKKIKSEHYVIPIINDEQQKIIDTKVSVVIPTKNAGPEFKYTLMKLRNQKGIREVEIVVVDSGSVDSTVATAEEYGAKVCFVDPSEFNHGVTRNLGAERSSGEFIVFMSQDVIPAGDFCIFRILDEMSKDDKIAAASVRQLPRSDADLFSCWQLWYYNNKLLDLTGDRIAFSDEKTLQSLSALEKRRLYQVDNIFSCVRRKVFDTFRFNRLSYGEDIELGIRLVKAGYKILFFSSIGGIHSHNRPSAYFLKRSCVDTMSLLKILEREPAPWEDFGITSLEDLLSYVYDFYLKIDGILRDVLVKDLQSHPLEKTAAEIRGALLHGCRDTDHSRFLGDRSLNELFDQLLGKENTRHRKPVIKNDILLNQFLDTLDSFFEYLAVSEIAISDEKAFEFHEAFYKLFAIVSGSNIGDYLCFSKIKGDTGKNSTIEHMLGQSI